jgi:hypothetical protein
MAASTETLERMLVEDLSTLGDRLRDEHRLARDLYRALASRRLVKQGVDGYVALSRRRAAEIVDAAREANGLPPIEGLFQSGGEGDVTPRAEQALAALGWRSLPEDTSEHDPRHVWDPESPPQRPRTPPEWERRAHEEAERNRERKGGTGQAIPGRQ